jgi:hypothetical protein
MSAEHQRFNTSPQPCHDSSHIQIRYRRRVMASNLSEQVEQEIVFHRRMKTFLAQKDTTQQGCEMRQEISYLTSFLTRHH